MGERPAGRSAWWAAVCDDLIAACHRYRRWFLKSSPFHTKKPLFWKVSRSAVWVRCSCDATPRTPTTANATKPQNKTRHLIRHVARAVFIQNTHENISKHKGFHHSKFERPLVISQKKSQFSLNQITEKRDRLVSPNAPGPLFPRIRPSALYHVHFRRFRPQQIQKPRKLAKIRPVHSRKPSASSP